MIKPIDFWTKVEKTNPKYTKNANVSGQQRTAVDAQYKKKMITEQFGMYGLGWGVKPESEKYERCHFENQTCILTYTATAFYKWEGEVAEFPIAAQIKESYVTKNGSGYLKIDDEAVKKVRTDALTKGFTDLGFCADIHMGMFDDQDYVHGAQMAAYAKEQEEKEEAAKKSYEEIKAWLANELKSAETVSSNEAYNRAIDRLKQKVETKCKVAGLASRGFTDKLENSKREIVK
ncbi:MAG: hypothetical protein Unbinned4466contig1000_54 [Prokaryotic dsDNA virus sp.]|nr:MAG: hypothetical protein Unbinned4466contig1000_54 [Prokaryotic dsDNA virus sp.]|tara:strand:- start:5678 stop:6376 length:699 start_codon:yes stop_codon:yes gene_type:complete